ncbi:MAG: TrbI/VirB10 family protein [Bryobacteraceae bacterium]|nr:TrbI/VirB10 family protein [Bryobacteraceae bacterium]
MTPDNRLDNERIEREFGDQADAARLAREDESRDSRVETVSAQAEEPESSPAPSGIVQQFWQRFKEERNRPKGADTNARGEKNMDRSKAFLVLATAVVLCGFAFLALFSTSNTEKRGQDRRTTPNLGRPANGGQQGGASGSTIPLLSADQGNVDQNGDQLSPDDINATSRRTQAANQPPAEQPPGQYALSQVPPVNDPALDAYRQQMSRHIPPQPIPPPAPPVAPPPVQPVNVSDALNKPSLVFVRNITSTAPINATRTAAQAIRTERNRTSTLLPTGTRLVARLQSAISSAVKTPVIAVIEYNYERDGEVVIPAGTKAIGELAQTNQNGDIGLRFTALEMPDGSPETIEGSGVSLNYGPLKGTVNGRGGAKRALVRSLTGIGSMAAYLVGGRSYGGLSGPIDQSILLRERIASNVGLAGEQELMRMAYTQNIVITLPGNTRFYIVLQEAATTAAASDTLPASVRNSRSNLAGADAQALPTAAELRELVALKNELNRMYREVAATRSSEVPVPEQ